MLKRIISSLFIVAIGANSVAIASDCDGFESGEDRKQQKSWIKMLNSLKKQQIVHHAPIWMLMGWYPMFSMFPAKFAQNDSIILPEATGNDSVFGTTEVIASKGDADFPDVVEGDGTTVTPKIAETHSAIVEDEVVEDEAVIGIAEVLEGEEKIVTPEDVEDGIIPNASESTDDHSITKDFEMVEAEIVLDASDDDIGDGYIWVAPTP